MTGGNRQPIITEEDGNIIRIRRLTPSECFKLQGFSEEDFNKVAKIKMSDTQLYKQAGNSICVSVIEAIYKKLAERYEEFEIDAA